MGGEGFSVHTLDKLSHTTEEDTIDTQPLKDIVTESAIVAAKSPVATAAFEGWAGKEDASYAKDFTDFLDLIQEYGSLSKVPLDRAGKYLADREGTVPWEPAEVQEFINRPHVQEWAKGTDAELARMEQTNEAPVPSAVLNVAGRKGSLLKNERVNQIVENFSKDSKVTDAFGGSGQLAQFVKGAGATDVTLNIKDPQMRGVFDEIKHNTEDFANRVAEAVEPIVSNREQSTPTVEGGGSIREYLNALEQTDPNVALFIKQNLNAQGREVTGTTFTPTKTMSSVGLRELPNRIREFSGQIDRISGEDGWNIVANAQAGDKITVDPPYVGEGGKYTDTPKITTEQQLANYEKYLYPAAERGAQFVVFDVADPVLIKSLQDHGFTVEEAVRSSRGKVTTQPELIAHNDPTVTPAPETRARIDAPEWAPTEQRDIDMLDQMGINRGGRAMNDFVGGDSRYPLFVALAKDLARFGASLDRITGKMRSINVGAFTRRRAGQNYEVAFSPSLLRSDGFEQRYYVAHELVHGLSIAELDNPTKVGIKSNLEALRNRVIEKLPTKMRAAFDKAVESDWYGKTARGEKVEEFAKGLKADQRSTLYGLLDPYEFVAQGLSSRGMQLHLQGIKSEGQTWFHRFAGLVKALVGVGEKIPDTAFAEFLSHTDQLLSQGNYVSSFRNFSDRYFENLGMSKDYVNANTQRAMSLLLNDYSSMSPDYAHAVLRQGAGIRSPEWARADRDVTRMFSERGDDAIMTQKALDETGHSPNKTGLLDLADSLALGDAPMETLDILPESAARFVFETAKDAQNIFGAIRAAAREKNQGILNIADPELVRNVAKEVLHGIDKVVEQNRLHDMQVRDIQNLFSMTPDGFYNKVMADPAAVPEEFIPKTERSAIRRFLEPVGQIARTIPEAAEAFARGWQLTANARKMLSESMKVFGMDMNTRELTKETVRNFARALKEPHLVKAANDWIYENQTAGERIGEIRVIDADDPRVQKLLGNLSAKDRDIVEDIVNKHQISVQHMQEQILEKRLQIASTNGAVIAQQAMGGKLHDSVALADQLLKAFIVDRSDPAASAVADSQIQQVQSKMTPDAFLTLARFTKNAADMWSAQKELFNKNPAWSSAQRYGKFIVEFRKGGKAYVAGVDSRKEAESLAEGRPFKITPNKQDDADRPPVLGPDSVGVVNRLRELEQNQLDILRNSGAFSPDQIREIERYSPSEQFATEETYRGGVPGLTPQPRRLSKGAEELPWLRNHFSWVSKTANYWSRQLLRAQARAHLLDPEIVQNEQLHQDLATHYENILQPDSQTGRLAQRAAMTWFMGFNPASAMINATQPFLTHVAELTSMSGKPLDSYRRVLSALKEVYAGGLTRNEWKNPEIAKLMHEATVAGERDLAMFDDQAAAQESIHTNYKRILSGNREQTLGQRLSTMAGNFSSASMILFKTVERINNDAALIASYKYYRETEPNLSPDQAIQKAFEFNHAVNFGGGRAQRPIGAFAGRGAFPRTTAMLATAMQSYNLGTAFQIARYIRQGFFRPEGLTPAEVHSARTAVVQMLGTQLAAAGVLGLPFVSGMLSVLNQAFPGLEVNRKLRETMAALTGGDVENGHVLNDIAMTGVPSMLGWDLQSRLSMGNTVPGVSEVNGFQPENLLGAPANLVANFVRGGFKLASGDIHGVDDFMPSALKKLEQLMRSDGQVLDYRNRPIFTPTLGEKVGITLGFNPKRLSDFNAASRIATQADDNIKRREGRFHQQLASEVLKGNFGTVRQALRQRIQEDSKYDPSDAVRSIAGAAEELTFPRDLRREGTVRSSDIRNRLLESFGISPTQPSEVDRLKFRQAIQQRLGLMSTSPTGLQTATVMDQLRQVNPSASRAELRRQASLLSHGRRFQTLALPPE